MQTRKITIDTDQYYIEALVHYTIDQEGDGIDSPVMTEVEIEEIEIQRVLIFGDESDVSEDEDVIKEMVETKFRKL